MRIVDWSASPIHEITYRFAARSGGVGIASLQVTRATVATLPEGLDALVLAADLQGREDRLLPADGDARLLGEVVAEELALLGELGVIPESGRIGVILAGDLYATPDLAGGRGGSGDVRAVWEAFRVAFRWVCGVAGNHDLFGETEADRAAFADSAGLYYLDGDVVSPDGLLIAGVGGIIGRESREFRRSESQFRAAVNEVLTLKPDLLVLHSGPDVPGKNLPGSAAVRECLLMAVPTLVVCGHCHWEAPLESLANGTQVCNVDSRVVVLCRTPAEPSDAQSDLNQT